MAMCWEAKKLKHPGDKIVRWRQGAPGWIYICSGTTVHYYGNEIILVQCLATAVSLYFWGIFLNTCRKVVVYKCVLHRIDKKHSLLYIAMVIMLSFRHFMKINVNISTCTRFNLHIIMPYIIYLVFQFWSILYLWKNVPLIRLSHGCYMQCYQKQNPKMGLRYIYIFLSLIWIN